MTSLRRPRRLRTPFRRWAAAAANRDRSKETRRRSERYADAYREFVAAVQDRPVASEVSGKPPSARAKDRIHRDIRLMRMRGELFELVSRGHTLESAAVTTVRKLIKAGRTAEAVAFADALASKLATAPAGHLAAAVAAVHRKLPGLAYVEFSQVPADLWRVHAICEFLEATFRSDLKHTHDVLRAMVNSRHSDLGPEGWFEVVRFSFAIGDVALAERAYELLVERCGRQPGAWSAADTEIEWLRPWLERDTAAPARSLPAGYLPFALLDYRQPSRLKTSKNIGDYIQSVAALGHLVRHRNVRFHGDEDLAAFAQTMQVRVKHDRRIDSPTRDIALFTVNRDASSYADIPVGTWMFAFGWYLHPLFGLRYDFPLHPNLRPIFVSFHCNKRDMLTPAAIEYLRRYGPVGCRDWTTVDLLLSVGVPAFFSGCVTTTVDTVFPKLSESERPPTPSTVYVDATDLSVPEGASTVRHSYPEVRNRAFAANLRESLEVLEYYRRGFTKVTTSRLHCYLPARALGLEVDFRPKNRADVRFAGLTDIDDAAFEAIRASMFVRLEAITTTILAGKSEAEAYELWRDINADDVAAARARHASAASLPMPPFDVVEMATRIRGSGMVTGPRPSVPALDVVSLIDPSDLNRLPVMVESLLTNASRPVRLWLLARGCRTNEYEEVVTAFPDLSLGWLPCDDLPSDSRLILLPELLPELDRVTVLPPTAVVLGDITELAERDLGEMLVAAKTSLGTRTSGGFGVLYRAAKRADASMAFELYRLVHARHTFDFDAFDTAVLALDLARMRKDGMAAQCLSYIEQFGLTAAESITLYIGPNRAVLPPEWAHVPNDERIDEPFLVHWPRSPKPWQQLYAAKQELWHKQPDDHPLVRSDAPRQGGVASKCSAQDSR